VKVSLRIRPSASSGSVAVSSEETTMLRAGVRLADPAGSPRRRRAEPVISDGLATVIESMGQGGA
jgi:hypothetical protein